MGQDLVSSTDSKYNIMLSVSLVLYNNRAEELCDLFKCFQLVNTSFKFIVVDNSSNDNLRVIVERHNFEYIHNPLNTGFGSAHNIALRRALDIGFKYHLIVNPDISFDHDVVTRMLDAMISDDTVGMLMPEILNKDFTKQYLPKLLPSPFDLLKRKLKWLSKFYNKHLARYELRFAPDKMIYNSPIVSGCFTMINLQAIRRVGMFDESFFMYFEDFDLSRRVHAFYKTLYFPSVYVIHGYESGANKSFKLLFAFMKSAFMYFNKWGWFNDRDRDMLNAAALGQFTSRKLDI